MSLRRLSPIALLFCLATAWEPISAPHAAEPASGGDGAKSPAPAGEAAAADRDERFRKMVASTRLAGHFTVDGVDRDTLRKEEYVITSATKLGKGDLWMLTSRIKYGTIDLQVPVPVKVKWAGDTPVITLDKVGIPGLGTFSARVVLDQGRYAGTWSHDEKGGHLFGTITPVAPDSAAEAAGPPAGAPPAAKSPRPAPTPDR